MGKFCWYNKNPKVNGCAQSGSFAREVRFSGGALARAMIGLALSFLRYGPQTGTQKPNYSIPRYCRNRAGSIGNCSCGGGGRRIYT